jgi:hypothetical protein
VEEPLAELAGYFRRRSRVPDAELVRLTAAARAAGSRWGAMAMTCGIMTYHDMAGVIYRITRRNRRGVAVLWHPERGGTAGRGPAP